MNWRIFIWLILVLSACSPTPEPIEQRSTIIVSDWEFRQIGEASWLPATVPGCVQTDLMANNALPDPFLGNNEAAVQWVNEHGWEYRTQLHVEPLATGASAQLVFEGLDTYAEILIDGDPVATSENMFVPLVVPLSSEQCGKQLDLVVRFSSPTIRNKGLASRAEALTAQNDADSIKTSLFTRKVQSQFGWDWAPRLVTMGIWKPVRLEVLGTDYIVESNTDLDRFSGELGNKMLWHPSFEIHAQHAVTATFSISGPGVNVEQELPLSMEDDSVQIEFNPQLWWPTGMGEQALYEFSVQLLAGDQILDELSLTKGFRTIELVREPTLSGTSFYLEVNGQPLFAKGANTIPLDAIPSRIDSSAYDRLIENALEANMNMLRVWGGGMYEHDYFYELCDRSGILVWQDFMFANAMYPAKSYLPIELEIEHQIQRLKNHPSLALWCGNNEIEVAWNNWGWQQAFNIHGADSAAMWHNYTELFEQWIPAQLSAHNATQPYISTSPLSNWGTDENFNHHNMHYWGVWHGTDRFQDYRKYVPRFMSEYGFQSFPEMKTIAAFADSSQWAIDSEVMLARQKSYKGSGMITDHMQDYFPVPERFEDYVYVSQLLQAKGMRMAIDAHRAAKPHCMGTLFWQFNDCWPAISWSAVDYYGRRKAAYFAVKDRYQEVIVVPEIYNGSGKVTVVSDRLEPLQARLVIQVCRMNGEEVNRLDFDVDLQPNEAKEIIASNWEQGQPFGGNGSPGEFYVKLSLIERGKLLDQEVAFAVPEREVQFAEPNMRTSVSLDDQRMHYNIVLRSDNLAEGVHLSFPEMDGRFSENYFTLLPNEPKIVTFQPNDQARDNEPTLKVQSLNRLMLHVQ